MEVFTHVVSLFSRKSSKVKEVAHCQNLELVKNDNFDFDIQGAEIEFAPPLLHSYVVKGVQILFPHSVSL